MPPVNGPKLEHLNDSTKLADEIASREKAVRDRAFALAQKRGTQADPLHDWLEAQRSLFRRADLRLSIGKEGYLLEFDLPGVAPKDIEVRSGNGRLVMKAVRSPRDGAVLIDELGPSETWRDVTLPPDADSTSVKAKLKDGVLSLTVARRPAPADDPAGAVVSKRVAKRPPARSKKPDR